MVNLKSRNVLWFKEISKEDIPLVGGKGANLGELVQTGIPVPPGFAVTAKAYFDFIHSHRLDKKIRSLLNNLNPEDTKRLNAASKILKEIILKLPFPPGLKKEITRFYQQLYTKEARGLFVAVRSSATAEDLPTASFAGQQSTFLNIYTAPKLIKAVQYCWASLFEARSIYYRQINKFNHLKVGIAVVIQSMVQSDRSGVMFTIDPTNNDKETAVIDAGYGLGEAIVSGSITPDRYLVDKKTLRIKERNVNRQTWKIVKVKDANQHIRIPQSLQEKQKLSDEEIIELTHYAVKIEDHYQKPQDTEWAIDDLGKIYFVQSRPVTTTTKKLVVSSEEGLARPRDNAEILVKGAAASFGLGYGPVKIIHSPADIDKVAKGDVLVTEMTNPSFVPAMHRAAAIVTDTGGVTSHAAIVSRELGIPCVVGAGTATHQLKNGQIVTVDGAGGVVYKGRFSSKLMASSKLEIGTKDKMLDRQEIPITATKVYVNLAEPELAQKTASLPADGVGLLRAEFIVAGLGKHPRAMVKSGQAHQYVRALSGGMRTIARAFYPRPVVYRSTDFKSNEYRALKGGYRFEPQEENPMIGYRGCFRYLKEPDLFRLELEAIKIVREKYDLKNLWLMLPFVRTIDELKQVKELIEDEGLKRSHDFRLWMMVEIPSNVILIDRFIDIGIDGVSIGSNDLTQLTLGIDRDSPLLAEEFDERNEAVLELIQRVIKAARLKGITSSVCGQAPSVYPDFTEFLIKNGITSVSVNPDKVTETKRLIASLERKILLDKKIK